MIPGISFITSLIGGGSAARGWVTIGLGVALAGAVLAAWLLLGRLQDANETIGAQAQQIQQAIETAEHNAEMLRRRAQQAARDEALVVAALAEERARKPKVQTIIKEVLTYVPTDQQPAGCPAIPGPIERALDGLRDLRAAKAADQGGGPEGHRAGGAAGLPGRP